MEKEFALPEAFESLMRALLKNEYEAFRASYEKERFAGLRLNPLKVDTVSFADCLPFTLTPVAWEPTGYYYNTADRPGKHILHEGGAYYIQEPSAMSAVAVLDPLPGDTVLDLCAAPGGKSTQIAGRLKGAGILVANEYVRDRSAILSQNIERLGVRNAVVLNESADRLSQVFTCFFDKILVDAPCSGEGMFRKEEIAVSEWSPEHVTMCANRQTGILEEAAKMLKPGGVMVYSTCTFNPTEDENVICDFLNAHPEFSIETSPLAEHFSKACPEWADAPVSKVANAMRLWPHKLNGEGHFVAKLVKAGTLNATAMPMPSCKGALEKSVRDIKAFLSAECGMNAASVDALFNAKYLLTYGDNIYLCPLPGELLKGLKTVRPGLHILVSKKNRFEPAHSLAMALKPGDFVTSVDVNEADALKYLHGETLSCDCKLKGWATVSYGNVTLGLAKATNGILKNHYPKGLRLM